MITADAPSDRLDPWVGIWTTGLLAILLVLAPGQAATELRLLVLATVIYCSLSAFLHPRYSIQNAPFTPIVILKPLVIAAFCFNVLHLAGDSTGLVDDSSLRTATWTVFLGLLVADCIALFGPRAHSKGIDGVSGHVSERTLLLGLWVFYFLGWAWRLFAVSKGLMYGTLLATNMEPTAYSNLFATFAQLSSVAFAGILVFGRRLWPLMLLLPLELAWKWIGSSKAGPIYVIIPVLLALHARGELRINARLVMSALIAVALFLVSFVVVHEYRIESQRIILSEGYSQFSPIEAAKNMELDAESFDAAGDALASRLGWALGVAAVVKQVDVHSRRSEQGSTYLLGMSWLVPRALWPGKPDVSLGAWFGREFLGWNLDSRSEAEITVWGEAYLNAGFAGGVMIPALWIVFLQFVTIVLLRLGKLGLFILVSAYIPMLNALAVNVAVTIAALGQTLLVCTFLYVSGRIASVALRPPMDRYS